MAQKRKQQKKKKSNRWLYLLLLAVVGLTIIAAVGKSKGWFGKKNFLKVATEAVEGRTIIETVSANGKIYPEAEVSISSDVSGEVTRLVVEEGDSVKSGQLVAKIRPDIYESMVERAEAAANAARSNQANAESRIATFDAQIDQIQTQIDNARKAYDRAKQLFRDDIVSQAEVDQADAALKGLEAQKKGFQAEINAARKSIEGAGYNVQSADASLKEAKENLSRTYIYAPTNGIISKLNVEQGERVVGTTQMMGTDMMRVANFDEIEVQVDVSENDIIRVSKGDTAVVEVDAYMGRKFKGIVTHIANSAQDGLEAAADQVTNFTVKVRILKDSYKDLYKDYKIPFRPGMSATVDIQTKTLRNTVSIPIQAVTTREIPDSLKTGNASEEELRELVFVYDGTGKVFERDVKVGIQDEKYIQITDGLKADEEVVVAPYRLISKKLEDGKEVEKVKKEELYKKKEQGWGGGKDDDKE